MYIDDAYKKSLKEYLEASPHNFKGMLEGAIQDAFCAGYSAGRKDLFEHSERILKAKEGDKEVKPSELKTPLFP